MRIDVQEPEAIDVLGAHMTVVARMGDGDGETALIRSSMGPQPRMVPLHAHADVETFYVLAGRLDIYLDGPSPGWRTVDAGLSLTVPGNVRHAVRNSSGAPVDLILATTVRIARFFREIGRPPSAPVEGPPTPDEIARVHRTAEAYGYWMASPEENAAITR